MIIQDILDWLSKEGKEFIFVGKSNPEINGFCSLNNYTSNSITWVKGGNALPAYDENITLAVVQEGVESSIKNQIISAQSKELFFEIIKHFWGYKYEGGFVGQGTTISKEAKISSSVYIGYNCSIIGDVTIGDGTVIENNVVIIGKTIIGNDCHIQSGCVVGIDGFGYYKDVQTGAKKMIQHFGAVVIGNEVFVGAHTNIAKGVIDDTIISDGVKIAPSTHIGHNDVVGKDTTIICSELFGSVKIGENSYITASTVENQKHVGNNSVVGMGSVVTKDIGDNVIAYGIPAKVIRDNNSNL